MVSVSHVLSQEMSDQLLDGWTLTQHTALHSIITRATYQEAYGFLSGPSGKVELS